MALCVNAADAARRRIRDWEPYAQSRDAAVSAAAKALGCDVRTPVSHTIYDPRAVIRANKGTPPLTYTVRGCPGPRMRRVPTYSTHI